ncbi:MAG: GxxExxY protein [Paludibacter sp.]
MDLTKKYINDLVYKVVGACIEVHKVLGPGLLESVYHKCLERELTIRNINFKSEYKIPFSYKGLEINIDLRCDFFIENCLVLELKSVETILPIHQAQLLTYMRLLESPKGVLVNFNVDNIFYEGQQCLVNEIFRILPEN